VVSPWFSRLAALLLALAALRLVGLFAADPMLAVANNYDMIRVQACIDAYPDRDRAIPPEANSYDRPLERYRFLAGVGAPCFLTSEAAFALLAWPAMWAEQALRADRSFSVRWDGAIKLLLLAAVVIVVHRILVRRGASQLALGHAAVVALVLADPAIGLYLNGFYAEFSAVFFFYALLAGLVLGLSAAPHAPGRAVLVGIVLAAVGLALAKVQHVLTPLFVLGVVGLLHLLARRIDRRLLGALAAGAVLGAALQGAHLVSEQTRSMGRANKINTVFHALLPHAEDGPQLMRDLGLPAACAEHAGANWFTPGMAEGQLCPEALTLSRRALLRVVLTQPQLTARVVLDGVRRSRPWIPSYLGLVEGRALGRLPPTHPSLDRALSALPETAYLLLLGALPLWAAWLVWRRREAGQQAANVAIAILATYPWFSLAVVVLGDGYADTAKQSHLGTTAALAALVMAAALSFGARRRTSADRFTGRGVGA
jgi:hypothetical protein